ncbi:MAG: PHP domain-containing protein [Firmicutes bacterium]|nr:PHP domain-containing protein [Bacillota bacterium]
MKLSFDMHIHSALSPCGDNEMTPNNIVNMAFLKGLDIIAVTDHNKALNVEPVIELAREKDILVIPGIEVTTKEEVHVLCYFKTIKDLYKFENKVYKSLPDIKNNEKVFGEQLVLNSKDEIVRKVDKLLLNSSKYKLDEIKKIVLDNNGLLIPAHVDKKAYSLLGVLGFIPDNLGVKTIEISKNCDFDILEKFIDKRKYNIIKNSDAHYLKDINEEENYLYPGNRNIESIFHILRKKWGM